MLSMISASFTKNHVLDVRRREIRLRSLIQKLVKIELFFRRKVNMKISSVIGSIFRYGRRNSQGFGCIKLIRKIQRL